MTAFVMAQLDCWYGATGLLVEQRHAVREPQEMDGLVLAGDQLFGGAGVLRLLFTHMAAGIDFNLSFARTVKRDPDLHLERVAAIGCGGARRNRVEICGQFLAQSFEKLRLADGDDAIGPRSLDRRFLDGVV